MQAGSLAGVRPLAKRCEDLVDRHEVVERDGAGDQAASGGPHYQCAGKARRGQRAWPANPEVLSSWVDKDVADLADVVAGTPEHDVIHHYPGSHPGAQIAEDIVVPGARLSPALAGGRRQVSAQSDLLPPCQLGRLEQYALEHIERTRCRDPQSEHRRRLDT